jgi:hypothetical protein
MTARTTEQEEKDRAASHLATTLVNILAKLHVDTEVGANALAGALGAYVAVASTDDAQAKAMMRLMATQAHEQMELQRAVMRADQLGVVGHG